MRLFLAIFLPPLAFFAIGRPFAGIICLLLWMTIIGWCLAALWAAFAGFGQCRSGNSWRAFGGLFALTSGGAFGATLDRGFRHAGNFLGTGKI